MYFFAWENPATKPYLGSKVNRAAGRVIVNACGSVTIDVPMMRMPTYSWPHTHSIRGATLNLFQKTWVLGSGYWYS